MPKMNEEIIALKNEVAKMKMILEGEKDNLNQNLQEELNEWELGSLKSLENFEKQI